MNNFLKKKTIWVVAIICVILAGVWFYNNKSKTPLLDTRIVTRSNILQEVNVTGRVKPSKALNLGFEKSGRIQGVYAQTGDHITRGTLLAEIESSAPLAGEQEATAILEELKRGVRPEELAVKESELSKYEQDLTNEYEEILDIGTDAFSKADEALHAKMTGIFSGFKTSSYKFTYQICDSQLDLDGISMKYNAEVDFDVWRKENTSDTSLLVSNADKTEILTKTKTHLEKTKESLESVNRTLTLDCTIANTSLDTYRSNINTARSNINTILSTISAKKQTIASLSLTIAKIKNELALLKAGSSKESIVAQEARVQSAKGELQKHKIYAPISGTVTLVDAKVGEFANVASPLIGIISDSSFEIESNIPEADIAKVHKGDQAKITLDAYGSDALFEGFVSSIDPAETIIDNIPTYKVTLLFDKSYPNIKSGMTANIDIITAKKENILVVPQRSILNKESGKFIIRVNTDKTTNEVPVSTGVRGSDGTIEIIDGVNENDVILFSPK